MLFTEYAMIRMAQISEVWICMAFWPDSLQFHSRSKLRKSNEAYTNEHVFFPTAVNGTRSYALLCRHHLAAV